MKNILFRSISFILAFFISISGICTGGFFEKAHALSSEPESIVQDLVHSHPEDKSHSGNEHCSDENRTDDKIIFQTINAFQNQISSTLENVFSVSAPKESSTSDRLYKTDRTFLTNNSLQRHIRSVVMRF